MLHLCLLPGLGFWVFFAFLTTFSLGLLRLHLLLALALEVIFPSRGLLALFATDHITDALHLIVILLLLSQVPDLVFVCFILEVLSVLSGHRLPRVAHLLHDLECTHVRVCLDDFGPSLPWS